MGAANVVLCRFLGSIIQDTSFSFLLLWVAIVSLFIILKVYFLLEAVSIFEISLSNPVEYNRQNLESEGKESHTDAHTDSKRTHTQHNNKNLNFFMNLR